MRVKLINFLLVFFMVSISMAHRSPMKISEPFQTGYPVPPANKNMLFYLQRTHNTNTVIYELNYKSGTLDQENPVKVYWIRYADGGEKEALSSIQRNFAYGVNTSVFNKEKNWFKIKLVAYDKAEIYLKNATPDKSYRAYMKINGTMSEMTSIFIKTNGGSAWSPNVVYIEVKGKDASGKVVSEKIKPD